MIKIDRFKEIVSMLKQKEKVLNQIHTMVGFDGFIDNIARVVKTRTDSNHYRLFKEITEISQHIGAAAGKSCDLEMIIEDTRFGGNAPLMAQALGNLGIQPICMGAFGYPEILKLFEEMNDNCHLLTIGQPATTFAYEFNDGKIMFANTGVLDDINWESLINRLDITQMKEIITNSRLLALANWSLLNNVESIWQGILKILSDIQEKPDYIFFDLADPSKRSKAAIVNVLNLIEEFNEYSITILGMNENEARKIYEVVIGYDVEYVPLDKIARSLQKEININYIVVHPISYGVVACQEGFIRQEGFAVKEPVLTTGGGDNFNAGFCVGLLLDLSLADCLTLGMTVSSFYVKNGFSPSISDLVKYI